MDHFKEKPDLAFLAFTPKLKTLKIKILADQMATVFLVLSQSLKFAQIKNETGVSMKKRSA